MGEHTDWPIILVAVAIFASRWYDQRFDKILGLLALDVRRRVKRGNELTAILTVRIDVIVPVSPILGSPTSHSLLLLHNPQIIIIDPDLR